MQNNHALTHTREYICEESKQKLLLTLGDTDTSTIHTHTHTHLTFYEKQMIEINGKL